MVDDGMTVDIVYTPDTALVRRRYKRYPMNKTL